MSTERKKSEFFLENRPLENPVQSINGILGMSQIRQNGFECFPKHFRGTSDKKTPGESISFTALSQVYPATFQSISTAEKPDQDSWPQES